MKRVLLCGGMLLFLTACAPVLDRQLMESGSRDVPFNKLLETPSEYKGRLYILGGVILATRLTDAGSQIEALAVPVDSQGYLKEGVQVRGRFLAIIPRSHGFLDPEIYRKGREISLAGEFVDVKKGRIDEMEYAYPVFEIKQIYLWFEARYYAYPPYPYYSYPFLYDRWGRPYPIPYGPPPW